MYVGKVLCIVQARMGSERLPGKVMKKLGDKPMIEHTLSRAASADSIDKVVLATSDKETDKEMVEYLMGNGWDVFCGDENNVLKRYVDCESEFNGDTIIRITGDCPFIDPDIIDLVTKYYAINDYDYVRLDVPETFIRGFDVEVFSRDAMKKVYDIIKNIEGDSPYKEHVTFYMYNHPEEFSIGYVKGSEKYKKEYRICVDTQQDYELVTKIYDNFRDGYVSADKIVKYLDDNPDVVKINSDIVQKKN